LLHLLPSKDPDAVLQCHLVETLIPDYLPVSTATSGDLSTPPPEYHALSYTWGDPVFPKTLEVVRHTNETTTPAPAGNISVTENLHSALRHLRRPEKPLSLWVDAVCINQ